MLITSEAFATLTLYLLVFVTSVFLARLYENSLNKNQLKGILGRAMARILVILPVVLLIGLRDISVGYDTYGLANLLFSQRFSLDFLLETQHDPLSIIVSSALYIVLDGNTVLYFLIASFATLYILLLGIEEWRSDLSIAYSLTVYYLYFALLGMDQVKQILALSIFFLAAGKLFHGSKKSFFVLTTVAGFFHFTAFFGYLLILFKIKIGKHRLVDAFIVVVAIALTVGSNVLFSLLAQVFGAGAYSDYFVGRFYQQAQSADRTGLRFVLDTVPCILPLLMYRYFPSDCKRFLLITLLLTLPLRALGYESDFLHRLYYEPAIFILLAYPMVYKYLPKKRKQVFLVGTVLLLTAYFYVAYSSSHGVVPYLLAF